MVVMTDQPVLTLVDLPASINPSRQRAQGDLQLPPEMTLDTLERIAITQALDRFHGNRTHAAHALGISVRTLQRKLLAWETDPVPAAEQTEA
jgi:DNA-binding NtrC family response regulator